MRCEQTNVTCSTFDVPLKFDLSASSMHCLSLTLSSPSVSWQANMSRFVRDFKFIFDGGAASGQPMR
jgi:hypothetical protein